MKYLICVTNRVGSTWLCSMLASTGVAGHPAEHFNLPGGCWPRFGEHFAKIQRIDPLGIKTSYQDLMRAIEHVGLEEFRAAPCIWLRRKDTLAQAISNYRASATNQWLRRRGEPLEQVEHPPDREAILRFKAEYEHVNNVLWPGWFRSVGIAPLEVWYESMCRDPVATVHSICRFLDLPTPRAIETDRLEIQRDGTNDAWRMLFD
jgi:LPS sulfotransferase NodH